MSTEEQLAAICHHTLPHGVLYWIYTIGPLAMILVYAAGMTYIYRDKAS